MLGWIPYKGTLFYPCPILENILELVKELLFANFAVYVYEDNQKDTSLSGWL